METLKLIINCFNTSLLLSSRISTNLAGNQPVTKIPEIIYVKLTVRQIEVKWLIQMAAVGVNTREEKSTDLWGHWALQPNSVHPSVRWSEKWRLKKITMGYKLEARCVVCVCVCVCVCVHVLRQQEGKQCLVCYDSQWWCHSSWSPVRRHHVAQSPAKPLPVSACCATPQESFRDLAGGSPSSSQESSPRETRRESQVKNVQFDVTISNIGLKS